MEKKDLKKAINADLKKGLTYKQIMTKYGLKSNYLIKESKGLKNNNRYIKININIDTLKKLNKSDLSTLGAYFMNINEILKDKNTKKLIDYILKILQD